MLIAENIMGKGKIRISHFTILHNHNNNNNVCSKTKANRTSTSVNWKLNVSRCLRMSMIKSISFSYYALLLYAGLGRMWIVSCCVAITVTHSRSSPTSVAMNTNTKHVNGDFDESTQRRRNHRFVLNLAETNFETVTCELSKWCAQIACTYVNNIY